MTMPAASSVHFDTTLELGGCSSSDNASINEEWQYVIEILQAGAVTGKVTCDAFDVGPGLFSTQSGDHLRLSRSRLLGCSVPLKAGVSTLRMTLGPMPEGSSITPIRVDVFAMR